MTSLRERRAELGLVQMNLWIREEDRAAFAAVVEPFKQRAGELDPAQRPGRKRQEAARASSLHLERRKPPTPQEMPQRPADRRSAPRPAIALPCRLIFPTKPPAHIRNAMKDEGWFYDKLAGTWTADDADLVELWIEELTSDWHARIIGPAGG
ncbi:hypothetical protein AruPA_20410 [Acidiphilium sp. PA]|uniref:hypothetical protein n=1 Tax=Acidiphilium sp. PA TaxID=2871705 RepID=UPI0022435485|nr:hypothetical protein [Acidiphilium sp. PA]MCW8309385.1 hypothetical protein [Acidiphilium sp. PA]